MKFQQKTVITFKDIFPDEEPTSVDSYLEGIDKDFLLKTGTFLLGFSKESKFENPIEFLKMYFSSGNEKILNKIIHNLMNFVKSSNLSLEFHSFPYVISSLSLFEYAFDKDYSETKEFTNNEFEIKVFKAYLLLNQINTTNRTLTLSESTKGIDKLKHPTALLIGLHLNNFEVTNYDVKKILITQTIRAIKYFEFLESREYTRDLMKAFYSFYNVQNHQEYIKRMLPIAFSILSKEKETHIDLISEDNSEKENNVDFLNKFIVDDSSLLKDYDFKNIRSNPLMRIDDNTIRIIYPLFAMELMGNGLYFKFKYINDQLSKDKKVKNLYGLKTYEFSEKYIVHKILKEYFGNGYIQKNGDELDKIVNGAPDYYVRNGKKIFLFESKDILLNAEVKQSSDFNRINNELAKKLYKKDDGTPKAVVQLINNVKKILSNTLEFDKGYKAKNVIVHPILIIHNRMFNTAGINKWVNFWFHEELNNLKEERLNISNIKPLIIIDIDTLIYNKDTFSAKKINLNDCLSEYQNNYLNFSVNKKKFKSEGDAVQASKNSFLPFESFLENKIDNLKIRDIPKEFKEKTYGLFNST